MKMVKTDRFQNEYQKLPFTIKKIAIDTLLEIAEAETKEEIFQLKPVRKKDYFSINIGEAHRIGVKIKEGVVLLITIGGRAHIYNKFP
jgi:mRNA-degrading endonuclease RelE of RelBE toxin-antitoxin system